MKWTDVRDGLPEKEGEYIVTSRWVENGDYGVRILDYGHNVNRRWEGTSRVFPDGSAFGETWGDELDNVDEVIAWMPLPEPYRRA